MKVPGNDRTLAFRLLTADVETDQSGLPFFELVLDDIPLGDDWNFADPHLRRRGKPFFEEDITKHLGPHDLLGFRNRSIPTQPDIVVIGSALEGAFSSLFP